MIMSDAQILNTRRNQVDRFANKQRYRGWVKIQVYKSVERVEGSERGQAGWVVVDGLDGRICEAKTHVAGHREGNLSPIAR